MKQKLLSVFLGIILVASVVGVALVVYAKFFTEETEKKKEPVVEVSILETLSPTINKSNLTKHFFGSNYTLKSTFTNNMLTFTLNDGKEDSVYNFDFNDKVITVKIDDKIDLEKAKMFTQIITDSLGQYYSYKEGSFMYTVSELFEGKIINGLTYVNNENSDDISKNDETNSDKTDDNKMNNNIIEKNSLIKINTSIRIEPIIINESDVITGKEIIYGNWEYMSIAKNNYVVFMNNYLLYNIKIEHNSTYNIAKLSLDAKNLNDTNRDFTIISKLFDETKNFVNETKYDYSFTESKEINIKINHMLKNADDFQKIKYISLEIIDK